MFGMIAKLKHDGAFRSRDRLCVWCADVRGGNEWLGDGGSGGESRVRCGRGRERVARADLAARMRKVLDGVPLRSPEGSEIRGVERGLINSWSVMENEV